MQKIKYFSFQGLLFFRGERAEEVYRTMKAFFIPPTFVLFKIHFKKDFGGLYTDKCMLVQIQTTARARKQQVAAVSILGSE